MNYHSTEGTIIMMIPIVISLILGALMVLLGFYIVPAVVIFKIVDAILWKAEVKERKKQNEEK